MKNMKTLLVPLMTPELLKELVKKNDTACIIGEIAEHIRAADTTYIGSWIESLDEIDEDFPLIWSTTSFDKDPREIYEIPVFRKYAKRILEKYPQFLYYVERDTITIFLLATYGVIGTTKNQNDGTHQMGIKPQDIKNQLDKVTLWVKENKNQKQLNAWFDKIAVYLN